MSYTRASKCHASGCVEVEFIRASQCGPTGDCVEVSVHDDHVHVRDSKTQTVMSFDREEWTPFITGVKAGEFDGPWNA